jgi:hypothetical protein
MTLIKFALFFSQKKATMVEGAIAHKLCELVLLHIDVSKNNYKTSFPSQGCIEIKYFQQFLPLVEST